MRPDLARVVRYLVAGATAAAVHLLVTTAFVEAGGSAPVVASTVGFLVGLVVSYALQRRWVFVSAGRHRRDLPRFLTVIAVALGINTVIVHVGVEVLGVHYVLAQLTVFAVVPVSNYLLHARWTFR